MPSRARHARPARTASRREALIALAAASVSAAALVVVGTTEAPAASPGAVAAPATQPVPRPAGPRASRGEDRAPISARGTGGLPGDLLPECAADVLTTHPNGRLPVEALCALPDHDGHLLRPDAARALVQLAAEYQTALGMPLCLTDSYRSLGAQQTLAARKPGLAARPGTSEHGWGLAADLACGAEAYATPQHAWLVTHAGRFGWGQPDWAKDGGAREEPWHWEYLAGAPAATSP